MQRQSLKDYLESVSYFYYFQKRERERERERRARDRELSPIQRELLVSETLENNDQNYRIRKN